MLLPSIEIGRSGPIDRAEATSSLAGGEKPWMSSWNWPSSSAPKPPTPIRYVTPCCAWNRIEQKGNVSIGSVGVTLVRAPTAAPV